MKEKVRDICENLECRMSHQLDYFLLLQLERLLQLECYGFH